MATTTQTQVRCGGCNRRLADLVNELEAGQVLLELKCPRCGEPHLEVIRPQPSDAKHKAASRTRISAADGIVLFIVCWTRLIFAIV